MGQINALVMGSELVVQGFGGPGEEGSAGCDSYGGAQVIWGSKTCRAGSGDTGHEPFPLSREKGTEAQPSRQGWPGKIRQRVS